MSSTRRFLAGMAMGAGLLLGASSAMAQDVADQIQTRLSEIRTSLGSRGAGVLALMGYNVTPDGSANSVTINRGTAKTADGSNTLTLGQLGSGFTWSESFPLYMEGYLGYARYDPRAYLTGGEETRRSPLRWNNLAATIGLGYDIRLGEYLWLRPILNGSLGYAAPDSSLFGSFINYRTGRDISFLTDKHMNVYGIGGSLVLAYYDHRPARDIDVELRYTQIRLQTFGDTPSSISGRSVPQTLGLWARYRWPTPWEAFGRPVRWVIDGSGSAYLGDQRQAFSFGWSFKIGGGIEFDVGRYEVGGMGLNLSRVRLIGRYFYGEGGVTGTSFGIGISF